jgi:hypothetical protein
MKVNNINSIRFRENTLSREMDSSDALLMLRDTSATVKFRQNQEYARKADSVDTNPIVALGYKLVRTFNMLSETNRKDNVQAIDYKA